MNQGHVTVISRRQRAGLVAIAAVLFAGKVQAESAKVQLLERKLQNRDMVISELLERVEALERRAGMRHPARATGKAIPQEVVSASTNGTDALPGKMVVNEDEAQRALERSLARDGALLLRPGVVEIEPSLSLARQEGRSPTYVTSGGTTFLGEGKRNANTATVDLALRLGLPWDSQFEIGIPYQWREIKNVTNVGFSPIDSSTVSGAGTGNLRIGVAKTLLQEGLWRPDLVGRLSWDTGSGKSSNGGVSLGGGFRKLSGSLSAIKRQDPMAFVGGLSYDHYVQEDNIQPGAAISASFGSYIALSPESSLRLILSTGYQSETRLSGQTIKGTDRVPGAFIVGGSTLLAPKTLLNLSLGIGLTDDADKFSIMLSLPIRFD